MMAARIALSFLPGFPAAMLPLPLFGDGKEGIAEEVIRQALRVLTPQFVREDRVVPARAPRLPVLHPVHMVGEVIPLPGEYPEPGKPAFHEEVGKGLFRVVELVRRGVVEVPEGRDLVQGEEGILHIGNHDEEFSPRPEDPPRLREETGGIPEVLEKEKHEDLREPAIPAGREVGDHGYPHLPAEPVQDGVGLHTMDAPDLFADGHEEVPGGAPDLEAVILPVEEGAHPVAVPPGVARSGLKEILGSVTFFLTEDLAVLLLVEGPLLLRRHGRVEEDEPAPVAPVDRPGLFVPESFGDEGELPVTAEVALHHARFPPPSPEPLLKQRHACIMVRERIPGWTRSPFRAPSAPRAGNPGSPR